MNTTLSPDHLAALRLAGAEYAATHPLIDFADIDLLESVLLQRGTQWAVSVLGRPPVEVSPTSVIFPWQTTAEDTWVLLSAHAAELTGTEHNP